MELNARERASKGKSPVGSLTLRLDSQRGRLIVEVEDDGRGVDLKKVARCFPRPSRGRTPPEELAQAIFRPGFSTSATVNRLSGRGMGLSVVYETVHRLQGDVNSKAQGESRRVLSLVRSLVGIHQPFAAALLRGADLRNPHSRNRAALPHPPGTGGDAGRKTGGESGGATGPAVYGLAHLLQIGDASPALRGDMLPVMVLKSGARRFAVWVDEFLTERDALIQELGMPCPATGNISGGALLREGTVFVVLNPAGLVASCTPSAAAPGAAESRRRWSKRSLPAFSWWTIRSRPARSRRASSRRMATAFERGGRPGSLELLRVEKADLIITDIQMPRLDGFGLVEALKADSRLKGIPVIIVSSLERPRIRNGASCSERTPTW
jgi:two-component system chemotaxis sensor kinase CheA